MKHASAWILGPAHMRRVIKGFVVIAAVVAMAGGSPARARCLFSAPIVQGIGLDGGRKGGIVSTTDGVTGGIFGYFWEIGSGDPAIGPGNDQGLRFDRDGLVDGDIILRGGTLPQVSFNWSNSDVDGCLNSGAPGDGAMAVYLVDDDGSYGVMAVTGSDAGTSDARHDFDKIVTGVGLDGADIELVPQFLAPILSKVVIVDAGTITADVAPAGAGINFHDDGNGPYNPLFDTASMSGPCPDDSGCTDVTITRFANLCWNGQADVIGLEIPGSESCDCTGASPGCLNYCAGACGMCCDNSGGVCVTGPPTPVSIGPPIPGGCVFVDPTDDDGDLFAPPYDCDDDPFACGADCFPENPAPDVCDGFDQECDGLIDEDHLETPTTCGLGQCAGNQGQLLCQSGAVVDSCDPSAGASPEICDGFDNDCDGAVDQGNPGGGGACGSTDVGVCQLGAVQCLAGSLECVGNIEPVPEICDGLDNDCDGTVDGPVCGVGDRVWEDTDGDGIQSGGEPGVPAATVLLLDAAGSLVGAQLTDASGGYGFSGLTFGADYKLRFVPPTDYVLTLPDQGGDDTLDSDADPTTWETLLFTLGGGPDPTRWDAGMIQSCIPPDEPIFISGMRLTTDGNDYPILDFQDPNQPSQITGYDVFRSSDASLDPATWPKVASDVIDMDEATPNKQWVDTSGDVSPTGIWFYQVTAFNGRCPAGTGEGPF